MRRRQEQFPALSPLPGPLPGATAAETFQLIPLIANPGAAERNRRYVDFDLNRCFGAEDLCRDWSDYERQRAEVLNRRFGPKGSADPACQLLIDLHTTTAELGPTVIINEEDLFARLLAAAVQAEIPHLRILSYFAPREGTPTGETTGAEKPGTGTQGDKIPGGGGPGASHRPGDYPYLAEITSSGIEVEIGPIAQGTLRGDIQIMNERIVNALVATVDRWNRDEPLELPGTITVYRFTGDQDYPRDHRGRITAMIHPEFQGRDFQPLTPGAPLFLDFQGHTIPYEGSAGLRPVFINEASYYEKHTAFTLTEEQILPLVPPDLRGP